MRTLSTAYAAICFALILCAFGLAGNWTYQDEVKAEEHAEYMARKYRLRDAGREREEMRQLAMDVQWAELSEKALELKRK